jgi:uncharacterized protein YggU (UPF0235/DUF167 family)
VNAAANTPARLAVRVTAGAARAAIGEWHDGRLRVRVSAAAERGRANAAVTALVAKTLGLPKSAVRIAAGRTSPQKMLEIDGMTKAEVLRRLR